MGGHGCRASRRPSTSTRRRSSKSDLAWACSLPRRVPLPVFRFPSLPSFPHTLFLPPRSFTCFALGPPALRFDLTHTRHDTTSLSAGLKPAEANARPTNRRTNENLKPGSDAGGDFYWLGLALANSYYADTAPAQPEPTRGATTTAAAAPTTSSNTTLIQIVIAAVCGVLLLALVMFILWKYRRRQNAKAKARDAGRNRAQEDAYGGRETPQAGEVVSRTHPAGLMIMKADGSGTPRFVHTPGTNMRTAIRRADGAWEFSDPRAPFRPEIIADDVDRGSVYTNDRPDTPSHSQLSYVRTYSRSPSPAASAGGRSDAGVNELLVPQRQTVAPWGAVPKTSASEAWRGGVYSPEPTTATANKTFLPPPLPSTSSSALLSAPTREQEDELVSPVSAYSNVLYVDVDRDRERDPFRTPGGSPRASPSPTPRRPERTDPLWTPAPEPGKTFLDPPKSALVPTRPERTAPLWTPAPTQGAKTFFEEQMPVLAGPGPVTAGAQRVIGESRAAREIRLGYEALDRGEGSSSGAGVVEAGLSPAARAKEAESRAARAIRQGYDERDSEYAEMEELPAY
uniref:Proteophosphoglycan ppg4 n=1 Tax=Mycena chlorophos TaxID=658473 RepID=A0ABQ0M396_MYCCL|nr:predicted protein [Mycena chlorophos]